MESEPPIASGGMLTSTQGRLGRAIPARDVEAHARLRTVDRDDPSERYGGSDTRGVFVQLDRFQAGLLINPEGDGRPHGRVG